MSDGAHGSVNIAAKAYVPPTAPVTGAPRIAGVDVGFTFANGTGDQKIQNAVKLSYNLAFGATQTIDLRSLVDANGDTISLGSVAFIGIETPTTNPTNGNITLAPGAANPWTALLTGTTPALQIPSGTVIVIANKKGATEYPTTASDKTLTFTNTSGDTSASFDITLWGI